MSYQEGTILWPTIGITQTVTDAKCTCNAKLFCNSTDFVSITVYEISIVSYKIVSTLYTHASTSILSLSVDFALDKCNDKKACKVPEQNT